MPVEASPKPPTSALRGATERRSRSRGSGPAATTGGPRHVFVGRTQARVDDCPTARVARRLSARRKKLRLDCAAALLGMSPVTVLVRFEPADDLPGQCLARVVDFAGAARDPGTGSGTHLVEPDLRTNTSQDRFAGGLSRAGSATNQTVAAASPTTRIRSGSRLLATFGPSSATAPPGYACLAADTLGAFAGRGLGACPVWGKPGVYCAGGLERFAATPQVVAHHGGELPRVLQIVEQDGLATRNGRAII
jgi:hypothetical protein